MTWLDGDLLTARPTPNSNGLIRLGIGETAFEKIEVAMITHAAAANLQTIYRETHRVGTSPNE